MMIKAVAILIVGVGLIYSYNTDENIRYFQTPTISLEDTSDIRREQINDSIYQVTSSDGSPLFYFTQLNTGVCFDNKCRPLSIDIFWNITGRYLGFELPDEEFLSKTDHEPFTNAEYLKLDSLLANPFLPLGNYAFYDLVDTSSAGDPEVDGISGATARDVKDYLVPGAAYTTHKLWNVIHGPIQYEVIKATENELNDSLFIKILNSPVSADRIWAAERTHLLGELSTQTVDTIVSFIKVLDYSESYFMLKSMKAEQLHSDYLQSGLFRLIGKIDYALENQIFDKLKEPEELSPSVLEITVSNLRSYSDMQLVNVLKLLKHQQVGSPQLRSKLEKLAITKNAYIKNQIDGFLKQGTN